MSSPYESKARIDEIRRCIETKGDLLGLREHLQTVVSGSAFRGSARSGQFLKHVVSLALAGDIDSLKERSIGIELFGRTPSYDTGEDAIVRVTASDVRKRLAQHYATVGAEPEFRINLPPGSYIPEILHGNRKLSNVDAPKPDIFASLDLPSSPATPLESKIEVPAKSSPTHNLPQWIGGFALALLLAVSGLWLAGRTWVLTISPRVSVLPWSTLFHSSRPILLITSDPNIAEIQALAGAHISVSDYANQNYIPKVASMSPEAIAFSRNILRGNKADSVDTPIIARASERHGTCAFPTLTPITPSSFSAAPLPTRGQTYSPINLIFASLTTTLPAQEIIRNYHAHTGEPAAFIPTAKAFGTGQSFATVSSVRNRNHSGDVLLVGGANAEGTKAAGELVTSLTGLASALRQCNLSSSDRDRHFQLLLRVSTMAGSPSSFETVACHTLP
jgi:hypothetical protein